MGKKVLICTNATIPLPGQPVTGAGLRAWSLGEGLRHHGFEVHYAMPRAALADIDGLPGPLLAYAFDDGALLDSVTAASPDVLIAAQWPLLAALPELEIPALLDAQAAHLLRTTFTRGATPEDGAAQKASAFQKADAVLLAGEQQRAYVQAWQLHAGVNTAEQPLIIVPPALSPELPEPGETGEAPLRVVYGGPLWPWLDPLPGLTKTVEVLRGLGTLDACVREPQMENGAITQWPAAGARERLQARLGTREHVNWHGLRDHDTWRAMCNGASLAFDLHQDNAERAIAYPMRTIEYLWQGVPVIHSRFSPLAPLIHQHRAGWIGDPANGDGLRQLLGRILGEPESLAIAAQNARGLVARHFTWDHALSELAAWVEKPKRRAKHVVVAVPPREVEALREALAAAETSLAEAEASHGAQIAQLRDQMEVEGRKRQEAMDHFQAQLTGIMRPDAAPEPAAANGEASGENAARGLLAELTTELGALREQQAAWDTERAELTADRDALHQQVSDSLAEYDEGMARWSREQAALEADRDALRAQLGASVPREEADAMHTRLRETEARIAGLEARAETAELKAIELEQLLTETAGSLQAAQAEAESLREEGRAREDTVSTLETDLAAAHGEAAQLREALARTCLERDRDQATRERMAAELEQLRDTDAKTEAVAAGLAATKSTLEEEVARLSEELNQASDAHAALTKALEEIEIELVRVREESAQARRAKESAEARAAALERDMSEATEEMARRAQGDHDWPERQEVMRAKLDRLNRELTEAQSARRALQVELETRRAEAPLLAARGAPADDAARREWAEERATLTRALEEARAELAEAIAAHQKDRTAWRDTKQALATRLKQLITESAAVPPPRA